MLLSDRMTRVSAVRLFANLVPFAGCLWLDWPVMPIVLIYWFENVMVGVTNVLKICVVAYRSPGERWIEFVKGAAVIVSFTFIYGLFTAVHGMAVVRFLDPEMDGHQSIQTLLEKIPEWLLHSDVGLGAAIMAVSHLHAFYVDFVERGQWQQTTLQHLANEPYPRMIRMHLGIMVGAFALILLDSPREVVAAAVLIKAGFDLRSQLRPAKP